MGEEQREPVISGNSEKEVVGGTEEPSGIPGCLRLDGQDFHVTTSIDNGSPNTAVAALEADQLPVFEEKYQILQLPGTECASPEGARELQDKVLIEDLNKERKETSNLLQISGTNDLIQSICLFVPYLASI